MKKANQNYYCRDYLQEHIVTGQERTAPKLKKSRYRLDIKKKIFSVVRVVRLEKVSQRSCGYPIPGSV